MLIAVLHDSCDVATKQHAINLYIMAEGAQAVLRSCSLSGTDLSGLRFAPIRFENVNMVACSAARTHFATMSGCVLDEVRLDLCEVVSIRDCAMRRARLIHTNIQHEFHRNLCQSATFEQVAFGAVWVAGRNAAIAGSLFERAMISASWLSGLLVEECDFRSTCIKDSIVARTSLRGCDLRSACFTRCNLIDTSLDGSDMERAVTEACILGGRYNASIQDRHGIGQTRIWNDDSADRLQQAAVSIVRGGDFRLRWMMREQHNDIVNDMMLWASSGTSGEGAVVWTRERQIVRMYPFTGEAECRSALTDWRRDCANWVFVADSFDVDDAESAPEETVRCVLEVLRIR